MNTNTNPVVIDAVPGQSYADISREFEAPAAAVFRAHADPELFGVWIGPRSLATRITNWDFRTGGGYRYEQSQTVALSSTEDTREAQRAFAEKRKPVFKGR